MAIDDLESNHNFFFFFGAVHVGEGIIEVEVQEAGTVLLNLRAMLGRGGDSLPPCWDHDPSTQFRWDPDPGAKKTGGIGRD